MIEAFKADPLEIAGLGRLVDEIGTQTLGCYRFFNEHAVPKADFSIGTLSMIREPFLLLEDTWRTRHVHMASNCCSLGEELKQAAWLYDDQDAKNYDAINAATTSGLGPPFESRGDSFTQATGSVSPYAGAVDYGTPDGIEYPPPATIADDFGDVIREAGGWVADVDGFIEATSGTSPIRELLNPIGGNWNEVRRLGSAFRIAGEAMEQASVSLESGVRRVDPTWDGQAAVAFNSYAHDQVEAMKWEGPCGRVIEEVADRIAEEMKKAVISVVRKLKELLDKEVDVTDGKNVISIAIKRIPALGTSYQIYTVAMIIKDAIGLIEGMVATIKEVTDSFAQFISLVTSPSGYLNDKFDEVLALVTRNIERIEMGLDIKNTADAGPMLRVPKDSFDTGTGSDPWADAV